MMKTGPEKKSVKTGVKEYDNVQYGLHYGEFIRGYVNKFPKPQIQLATELSITKQALQGKFNNPFYGNIYDVIKTSEWLGLDLLELARKQLVQNGYMLFKGEHEMLSEELIAEKKKNQLLKAENETLEKLYKIKENLKELSKQ